MKITKYVCDRCQKEIDSDLIGIVPMTLDRDNDELIMDNPEKTFPDQVERHYCRKCVDRILYFANHMAARDNPEFAEAVEPLFAKTEKVSTTEAPSHHHPPLGALKKKKA